MRIFYFLSMRLYIVRLFMVLVLAPLNRAIRGMGNVLRNSFILKSAGEKKCLDKL